MENPRIDCTDCTKGVPYWSELDFKDRLQQMPDPETLSPDTGHTKHKGDQKEVVPSYTKAEKANMHRLLSLLGKTPAELFQQAEIHRLNKRFGRAMWVPDKYPILDQYAEIKGFYKGLITAGDVWVWTVPGGGRVFAPREE